MNRSRLASICGLPAVLALTLSGGATAAPPLFEGLGQYRILDASGRIAPRGVSDSGGRVALRPAYPPPLLLRARLLSLSGYAGATYGPARRAVPLTPTTHHVGHHGHGH